MSSREISADADGENRFCSPFPLHPYIELQLRREDIVEHHLPVLVVEGRLPHSRLASLPVLRSSRREASPRSTSRPRGRRGVPAAPPAPRTPACLRWS